MNFVDNEIGVSQGAGTDLSLGGVGVRRTPGASPSACSLICYHCVPVVTAWMILGEITSFF